MSEPTNDTKKRTRPRRVSYKDITDKLRAEATERELSLKIALGVLKQVEQPKEGETASAAQFRVATAIGILEGK